MKILAAALAGFLIGCAPTVAGEDEETPLRGTATLRLGETARIAGMSVRALRVEEDSRCPSNVQCIHAGTVRLAVTLSGRDIVLVLDDPFEAAPGRWLRLAAVCPAPRAPGPISPATYRFTLSAAEGAPPPPLDHACPAAP